MSGVDRVVASVVVEAAPEAVFAAVARSYASLTAGTFTERARDGRPGVGPWTKAHTSRK